MLFNLQNFIHFYKLSIVTLRPSLVKPASVFLPYQMCALKTSQLQSALNLMYAHALRFHLLPPLGMRCVSVCVSLSVCVCVCVCTAPTCLVKTVQIQFTKQSQSLRTRNARCYLYRKWDLRDAIRKHDRHKPNQRADRVDICF